MTEPNAKERGAAYHEAGHGVAAFLLGIQPGRLAIVPDSDSFGHVMYSAMFRRKTSGAWNIAERHRGKLEDRVVALYAGPVAQRKAAGLELDLSDFGAAGDVHLVTQIGNHGLGLLDMQPQEQQAYLNWLQVRARLLVDDGWYLIEPLAAELRSKRAISARATQRLFQGEVMAKAITVMPPEFASKPPLALTAYGWRRLAWQVAVLTREHAKPDLVEAAPASTATSERSD